MNRRLLLGCLVLVVIASSAGCTGAFNATPISTAKLSRPAEYDWNASNADVYVNLTGGHYQAIYNVSNRSSVAVYDYAELGEKQPVDVSAVQFRYRNGTVVNASEMHVEKRNSRTVITAPADHGQIAFTAASSGTRNFQLPAVIKGGSYEVVLPRNMRIGNPLLGQTSPGGAQTRMVDGRVHVTWESVDADSISVRYYLQRDLWIFLGVVAVVGVVGVLLIGYVWFQIRQLIRRREELGLNMDISDDESGGGRRRR